MPNTVKAKVVLVVEVDVNSTWSPSTTMSQITNQAREEAAGMLRNTLKGERYKIIGSPKVEAIYAIE